MQATTTISTKRRTHRAPLALGAALGLVLVAIIAADTVYRMAPTVPVSARTVSVASAPVLSMPDRYAGFRERQAVASPSLTMPDRYLGFRERQAVSSPSLTMPDRYLEYQARQ